MTPEQIAYDKHKNLTWMTLDEFLRSGFVGACWIYMQTTKVYVAYFDGYSFLYNESIEFGFVERNIDQVMPIHKPEPPR